MNDDSEPAISSPLALTALEIRYPQLGREIGDRVREEMHEAVSDRLPVSAPVVQHDVQIEVSSEGPGPEPVSVTRRSFPRFVSRDRTTSLLVKLDALIIETTAYGGWIEAFRPLITDAVSLLARLNPPNGVERIGLRYINEIRVPGVDSMNNGWSEYIDDHLLAAADPEFIPEGMHASEWQGHVTYRTSAASALIVRYGPTKGYAVNPNGPTRREDPPEPGPFFLLDTDAYWDDKGNVPEFTPRWIMEHCDTLHDHATEFFRIATTQKFLNEAFRDKDRGQS